MAVVDRNLENKKISNNGIELISISRGILLGCIAILVPYCCLCGALLFLPNILLVSKSPRD